MKKFSYLFAKSEEGFLKIPFSSINYIKANRDYIGIYTNASSYQIHVTMDSLESRLKEFGFFRVHRSYLVYLENVTKVQDSSVYIGQYVIPLSKDLKHLLLTELNAI